MPNTISTQTGEGRVFDDFDEETKEDFAGASYEAQGRLHEALRQFSTNLASEQVDYRNRHLAWMAGGGDGTPPLKPDSRDAASHLEKLLSLFTEIFPSIKIIAKDFSYTDNFNAQHLLENKNVGGRRNVPTVNFDLEKLRAVNVTGKYSFNLICVKNGSEYSPSELSDGERQILALLAD